MKKIISLIVLFAITTGAFAQKARLNAYAAYVFDDGFDSRYDAYNYYHGTIKGGFQWGVGMEYMIKPQAGVELLYLNRQTHAPTYYQNGGVIANEKYENFDLGINYILVAPNGYASAAHGKVEGYGGFMIGMGIINIDNNADGNSATKTRFAWGLRLGANIWASQKVGIKLEGQLLSVAQGAGGGFYFGTGGAGAGLSTYSTIYQWGLGGGLTFKLGK